MPNDEHEKIGSHGSEKVDASRGYEQSDVRVTGILVFLTALGVLVVVVAVLSYGIGKVINAELKREDGPNSKWTKTMDVRELGNLPNNPQLQHQMATLTQQFPTPRVQLDDGNQDVADLHVREDLLLENYTRIDGQPGKVRIPIERAMQLVAERGLAVAPAVEHAPLMAGDQAPVVTAPLTTGFARTAYEQDLATQRNAEARRPQ